MGGSRYGAGDLGAVNGQSAGYAIRSEAAPDLTLEPPLNTPTEAEYPHAE